MYAIDSKKKKQEDFLWLKQLSKAPFQTIKMQNFNLNTKYPRISKAKHPGALALHYLIQITQIKRKMTYLWDIALVFFSRYSVDHKKSAAASQSIYSNRQKIR